MALHIICTYIYFTWNGEGGKVSERGWRCTWEGGCRYTDKYIRRGCAKQNRYTFHSPPYFPCDVLPSSSLSHLLVWLGDHIHIADLVRNVYSIHSTCVWRWCTTHLKLPNRNRFGWRRRCCLLKSSILPRELFLKHLFFLLSLLISASYRQLPPPIPT